jgi:hypothetical protein
MKNNANFLFILLAIPFVSFANYTIQLPLELGSERSGGSLPSGSIVFSGEQDEDPNIPYRPENDPRFKVCFDKKPQIISIVESYGGEFMGLNAYFDEELNEVGCVASYIANGQKAFIKPALVAIGVYTAE